jgi:hypothetical protein
MSITVRRICKLFAGLTETPDKRISVFVRFVFFIPSWIPRGRLLSCYTGSYNLEPTFRKYCCFRIVEVTNCTASCEELKDHQKNPESPFKVILFGHVFLPNLSQIQKYFRGALWRGYWHIAWTRRSLLLSYRPISESAAFPVIFLTINYRNNENADLLF